MIKVNFDMGNFVANTLTSLQALGQPEFAPRAAAAAVLPEIKHRIFVEGKRADGSQIGTYSSEYLKIRQDIYTNSDTFKKGKRKGEAKTSGVFTRGKKKGQPRPKYNRTSDPKIIFSLTRQMEGDISVIVDGGNYAIGFKNDRNAEIAVFLEERYQSHIFTGLTPQEERIAIDAAILETRKLLE